MVTKSYAVGSVATKRLDPEYFQKQYLLDEQMIADRKAFFSSASDVGVAVDASAFYPSIEEFYGVGDFPFYRVGDVDGIIDEVRSLRIPEELCSNFPTLKRVLPGDILFTKGGAIDRTGYVKSPGAVSRDLIFLNTSKLPESERLCLFAYFRTDLFRRLLKRSSSQTAQPHLTITLVRELPFFVGSKPLGDAIGSLINRAYSYLDSARNSMENAERLLLQELGLVGWTPPEPLSYTARAIDVFASGRIDAQYFRPLFSEVEARLQSTGNALELGTILTTNARGRQPIYADDGLPVVNSKHVRTHRVILDDNRTAQERGSPVIIKPGDVLVNGTGVGTIGRAAPYLHDAPALPDNHVTVLRTKAVDPIYLSVFLNSPLGQWQIERRIKGSSGQIELYPNDIAGIVIWRAPNDVQQSVRAAILSAFDEERHASDLLEAAKRAVEIAIGDGEAAAIAYLNQVRGEN
ncbi:restriction endonuclease subunit S [Rhizobium laguerreae]|nr:restriction endonuclease subunit S [Rhizobium laguerreae]